MKTLRILFIGNSHTYYNDMPDMVARRFRDQGYDLKRRNGQQSELG